MQVLGDGHNVIHCFERECSLQRRRQKVWEEAPAVVPRPAVRERLCASAVELARSVAYRGAGTLEYLYDDATQRFYFIEMNTRIQVEHPVTEMITRRRPRARNDADRRWRAAALSPGGHSRRAVTRSKCRINAEDPDLGFPPVPGKVVGLCMRPAAPACASTRCFIAGYAVPPFYDSLLGKLIVWDETREAAIARLRRALRELKIDGIETTNSLHQPARERRPRCAPAPFTRDGSSNGLRPDASETTSKRSARSHDSRYSFGGDEHIFVECDEEMSLEAFFKSLSITNAVREAASRA